MIKYKQATTEDLEDWWGFDVPYSCQAIIMSKDGEALAVGGVAYKGDNVVLFMEWREEAKAYPIALVKAGWLALRKARANGHRMLYALAATKEEERYLKHFGLRHVNDTPHGAVYQWHV